MSVTFYMSGRAKKLRTLPQIMEGETKAAIRRGQNRLRKALFDEFRSGGIGRAIFGGGDGLGGGLFVKRGSMLKTVIARERVKKTGEVYEVGVRVKGIAAIVAKGGRTQAHGIGSAGKALANPAAGFFAKGRVNHPGSSLKRDDFPSRAVAKTAGAFRVEIAKIPDRITEIVNRG